MKKNRKAWCKNANCAYKKISNSDEGECSTADENVDSIFSWTANWTRVWENRKAEDMLVLINNATRFTVAIYEVKRAELKNVEKIMTEAIINTLYAMNFNPEMIDAYMQMAGDVTFVKNSNRKATIGIDRENCLSITSI